MTYLITFLEGIVTFISPCLLPLLPVYVAYFAGGMNAGQDDAEPARMGDTASANSSARLRHTLVSAFGFVVGFTILFTIMGAFAATVGGFFTQNQTVLNVLCGIAVIFFGLHFMGVLKIPALQKTTRLSTDRKPQGFFSSMLFGIVFAIGWTPCVGAFLGSALALAASTGSTLQGVALLVCYSLGLGIPFMITAVLIDQLEGAITWVKRHYQVINMASGILLVAVGVLIATGQLGKWISLLAG